ncbi:VOC family protein [Exiguobacterium algae]|uniref:VOC family protein n=1 Tax=Exiguobacterium algae TaxID=2751250 RepID=UPI001BE79A67|nr:VOC family protein [Exiguobacterium algae]
MRIAKATLFTNQLDAMKQFYRERLGFTVISDHATRFQVALGEDILCFQQASTNQKRQYHFAINIPANRFNEAKHWIQSRVPLLTEGGADEIYFKGMDATSLYFYDADENVVELIARHAVNPMSQSDGFSMGDLLGIAEMSVTTDDPLAVARKLSAIPIQRSDGKDVDPDQLNFLGAPNDDTYLLLVPSGRLWLFSPKKAIPSPIQLEVEGRIVLNMDEEGRMTVQKRDE